MSLSQFEKMTEIVAGLSRRREKIGFAESCTSGLLSATFGSLSGVSQVFEGSVVTYSNDLKRNLIHVPQDLIESFGAVSEPVVKAMAHGALLALQVHWMVSITGIAGPSGGTPDKPVGTVWICVCGPDVEVIQNHKFSGSRLEIQKASVEAALNLVHKLLK